jgi:pullulanase/glycogen debranching enzyme
MFRTLVIKHLAVTTLVLAGASAAAYAADVYKWVDDKGGVHYSDQWVPGSEVIKSAKSHPNGAESSSPSRDPQKVAPDRATAQISADNANQAVKQDVAKVREQQCKEAKDRYDKAVQARRIYTPAKDGGKDNDSDRPAEREYLSDEEADAYRLQAHNDMVTVCGPSAATAQANQ